MGRIEGHNNRSNDDVLRAGDVMPPFGRRKQSQRTPQADLNEQATSRFEQESLGEVGSGDQIPKFDLAEGLLAGRRNVSSARRKSPGSTSGAVGIEKSAGVGRDKYSLAAIPSEQQLIIMAIVARDIERFCRGRATLAAG